MKKRILGIGMLVAYLLLHLNAFSQLEKPETIDDKLDTLYTRTDNLTHEMERMKKLQITGYVQLQFQMTDTAGGKGNSYAGGGWDNNTNSRFQMRRSRLKTVYENNDEFGNNKTQIVMQMEFFNAVNNAANGVISPVVIRDFYGKFTDPWTRWFGIKAGAMDKPFGYELTYSSGTRETPERGRMSQILFPGEKDYGAQLVIQPAKQSRFNWLKLETGLYNGTGVLNVDFDKEKDWISRFSFAKGNLNETIKYSGGCSYYYGGHKYGTKNNYQLEVLNDSTGAMGWKLIDSNSNNINHIGYSRFFGIDGQISFDWKGGLTTLRAEYIGGTHGGTATTNNTPRTMPTEDYLQRNFNGAYFYFIQNVMHSKHSVMIKYDWYDPNTKVAGMKIGEKGSNLKSADIKYATLGLGYLFNYDQNWKFVAYADLVKNELTGLAGYTADRPDNVYTLRLQYTWR